MNDKTIADLTPAEAARYISRLIAHINSFGYSVSVGEHKLSPTGGVDYQRRDVFFNQEPQESRYE